MEAAPARGGSASHTRRGRGRLGAHGEPTWLGAAPGATKRNGKRNSKLACQKLRLRKRWPGAPGGRGDGGNDKDSRHLKARGTQQGFNSGFVAKQTSVLALARVLPPRNYGHWAFSRANTGRSGSQGLK